MLTKLTRWLRKDRFLKPPLDYILDRIKCTRSGAERPLMARRGHFANDWNRVANSPLREGLRSAITGHPFEKQHCKKTDVNFALEEQFTAA
jgi:hypothetical protein